MDQKLDQLGQSMERLIEAKDKHIAELEAGTEKILLVSAKKEEQALESIKGLMERIAELEELGWRLYNAMITDSIHDALPREVKDILEKGKK